MLTGIREMELRDVPEPLILNPDDVKIKMSVVGICGSDVHYFTQGKIGSQVVKYPFTVGHEGAGIVIETGSSVKGILPGDLVAIDPAISCGECDQCLAGREHTCRKIKFLGCPGQAEGNLSEYIVMPERNCYHIPDNLSADHGSISEPLAIGVYSVKKSGDIKGSDIAILGYGPIGMSVMLAARAMGAGSYFVTDRINERLLIAQKENATCTVNPDEDDVVQQLKNKIPAGVDIVYECCGQQEAVNQAVEILKPGGKLIIIGIPPFDLWSLDVDETRRKEISIQFIRRQVHCVQTTIDLMRDNMIDVANMVTHRFHFADTKTAFDLVAGYKDGVMKAMIDF